MDVEKTCQLIEGGGQTCPLPMWTYRKYRTFTIYCKHIFQFQLTELCSIHSIMSRKDSTSSKYASRLRKLIKRKFICCQENQEIIFKASNQSNRRVHKITGIRHLINSVSARQLDVKASLLSVISWIKQDSVKVKI